MDTNAQLQAMRDEIATLRAEVERFRRADVMAPAGEPSGSRRQLLKLAAAGAAGAAVAAVGGTSVARAAGDGPIIAGTKTESTHSTELKYNSTTGPEHHILWVQDGARTVYPEDPYPYTAAISGWSTGLWVGDGVQGVTEGAGFGGNFDGRGVHGALGTASGLRVQGQRATIVLVAKTGNSIIANFERAPGEVVYDKSGNLWLCVQAGNPGGWRKLAGPTSSGQMHLLSAPVRCYDSRTGQGPATVTKGALAAGAERTVSCRVTPNGEASEVPSDALGVLVNVTVTAPEGPGYLAVYPAGVTNPNTSLLNFGAGQDVANGTSVGCGSQASITIYCGGGAGTAHFIVDVMGYYR